MKTIFIFLMLFGLCLSLQAQRFTITGRVIAPDRRPLANVTLRLISERHSAVSAADGSFTLLVSKARDTLYLSHVGYQSRIYPILLPLSGPLTLTLEPAAIELGEVAVSTGYYQVPRERATGSFTQLSEKALNTSVSTDILSRLQGVASGVSFDQRTSERNISIRGLSTIYANAQPLVVLNNFPYDGDIGSINPNDVESITILKDAAAASIWGVRAANGVIVVTTKKGAIGRPPEFSFNANLTYGHKPDVFRLPMMASADYIGVEKYLFANGFYTTAETDPTHPPLSPAVELLIAQRDGQITAGQLSEQLSALGKLDVRNDLNRYLYQNSLNQQYAFSARGGSERSTYYYSAGYDQNADDLGGKYARMSIRADNTFNWAKNFKVNPVISFSRSQTSAGRPDYTALLPSNLSRSLYPYAQFTNAAGNPAAITTDYRTSFIQQAQAAGLEDWSYRPLDDFKQHQAATNQNDLVLGLNTDYTFLRHFGLQGQYQYENLGSETAEQYGADSYYVRNLVNSFTQDNGSGTLSFPVPKGAILNTLNSELSSQTGRLQGRYNNAWGKHELSILAGGEVRQIRSQSSRFTTYGYNQSGLTSVPVDYVTYFPQYFDSGNYQGIPEGTGFTGLTNRYTSVYANAAYTFDNRYILSASGRKDESNLFGVSSNLKGVPLWSTGLAWNIHNEDFFHAGLFNYLKLRLTYGVNGNLSQNLTAVASLLTTTGNLNNQPYAIISTYPNPQLSWEKVGVLNLGLDFATRRQVLSGTLEVYQKNGSDLIGRQPIDPTIGIPAAVITRNVASMSNRGLDLHLLSRNIDRGLKWQTNFLFSISRDKITRYTSTATNGSTLISSGLGVTPVVGQPVHSIISYKWAGLDPKTGAPIGVLNGLSSEDYAAITSKTPLTELDYNGPALPPYFGSLANTFSYRQFSLYVNVAYRFGYYFRKPSISYYNLYNNGAGNSDFALRWQQPGDELHTYVPAMPTIADNTYQRDGFYTNSSALVGKADNIRLQDVNLSYQVPAALSRSLKLNDLQFYVFARNLGILWKADKAQFDPDYATGYLPPSYSLSFGIKTRF